MSCEKLVKHCTKPVQICCAREFCGPPGCLFRRHVTGCAQHLQCACDRALRFNQAGETKVSQMWFAFFVEKDVSRFDVSMQNAVFVRVMYSACHLRDELYR